VNVNLTGARELRMVVTNGGDNIDYDHADWANPTITCQAIQNQPLTMTVSPSTVEIFHKHTATVKATFSGTFNGPVNLSLPRVSPDGSVLTLQTSQVSLPASGTGTVTRDVIIEAPSLPGSLGDLALLTAQYRLVASQGGQERTSAPLTVTEKLLTVSTSLMPSSLSGPVGATRRVTATVTVSPALAQPVPITLLGTTQSTNDVFTVVPVGAPYGDGGTMKQDFDVTLIALLFSTDTSAYGEFYVQADSFSGYRLPYYGSTARSLTWTVQP
ncbi:NPCBM/NEW2 domain-containing protein, partial [Deinococcus humi]|uniref:NPCBM/NEW2 domain-containing protein n=1 Tax=Deinococcus humi TaxID=662880 RepID=UPI00161111EE